jgi:hypothetical protein
MASTVTHGRVCATVQRSARVAATDQSTKPNARVFGVRSFPVAHDAVRHDDCVMVQSEGLGAERRARRWRRLQRSGGLSRLKIAESPLAVSNCS